MTIPQYNILRPNIRPDNRLPACPVNLHVLPRTSRKHDFALLVERPETDPVFRVQRLLAHRNDLLLLLLPLRVHPPRDRLLVGLRDSVRSEPCTLLRHHCPVLFEQHHHERVEFGEAACVVGLARGRELVVERGEEAVGGEVAGELCGIAEVLGLVFVEVQRVFRYEGKGRLKSRTTGHEKDRGEMSEQDVPERGALEPILHTRLCAPRREQPGRASQAGGRAGYPRSPCVESRT